jgi:lantibiotic biosynthesis protein
MTTGEFQDVAVSIGNRLCRDALWAADRCNWTGASMEFVGRTWAVAERNFGPDLYAGTSGIALFLARLFSMTGEPIHRRTALGAARHALARMVDLPSWSRAFLFSGGVGIACALDEVATRIDVPRLADPAHSLLDDLPEIEQLDVIAGSAGAIQGLLELAARGHDDKRLIERAERYGEHLLAAANRRPQGWSWDTLPGTVRDHLTGYGHGAAGIALSLLELARVTEEARFAEAAHEGFRYERSWYSPQHENWPDLRAAEPAMTGQATTPAYGVAWCHGAVGIGLSRLRAWQITGDSAFRTEAEAALRTATRALQHAGQGGFENYSLCHGHAGTADFLIEADRVLLGGGYRALAEDVARRAAATYEAKHWPWPCGVMGGGETPGLMLGLAGIGYLYLRLTNAAFSSVLLLGTQIDRQARSPQSPGERD